MHRGIVSVVLSTCLAATAMAVGARAQAFPPTKVPETGSPEQPMVFYVAKGDAGNGNADLMFFLHWWSPLMALHCRHDSAPQRRGRPPVSRWSEKGGDRLPYPHP